MGLLGSMQVNFVGNTSGLQGSVGQAKNILGQLTSSPLKAVGVGFALAATAAIGFGAASIKMFGDYDQAMRMVQALTGSNTQQMTQYDASLKQLAANAGVAPTALAKGLYNVLSASYKGADAINVLTLATEDSKIGMTSAAVTTDALTNVLRSFGTKSQDITRVNGEMLETVTLGKSTFEQYAQAIVKSASASVQFHVSMETMNAAWATMTSSGIRAAQASTDFQSSLKVMYGNIGTVTKSLEKNGIAFDEAKFNTMSYGDKVVYLNKALQEANEKHVKVTGVTLQAAQAISTISNHIGDYNNNLSKLSDKQAMADKTQQAWAITQGGFNQSMDRARASLDVLMINIGSKLLPVLTRLAGSVAPIISSFSDWMTKNDVIDKSINAVSTGITYLGVGINTTISVIQRIIAIVQSVVNWFIQWHTPILAVAGAITAFFLPALIMAGIQAVINGAKITGSFIASMIQSGVQSAIQGARVTASFVSSMIKAGAEAWVTGPKIIGSFVASMVTSGAQAVASAAKVTASFIASMVQTGVQAGIAAAKVIASFVASMITTAAQAIITAASFTATLIPALISFAAEAIAAAATAIPAILAGFISWAIGAWAVAAANIAAFWPVYLVIAAIIIIVGLVVLAITHWGAISAWLIEAWNKVKAFMVAFWNDTVAGVRAGIAWIGGAINAAAAFIYHWLIYPYVLMWQYAVSFFAMLQAKVSSGMSIIRGIFQSIGGTIYNLFIQPFKNAYNFISGILGNIGGMIHNVLGGLGGTLHSLHIPGFASGVENFGGGFAYVHKDELIYLPQGSSVYPQGKGMNGGNHSYVSPSGGGTSGNQTIVFQMDSRELARITGDRQARLVRLKMSRRAA